MKNLNAENIINEIQSLIKALKDCGGWVKRGNGEGWFNHEILADALALIREKDAVIERLRKHNTEMARKHYNDGKADTVREMAEMLDKYFVEHNEVKYGGGLIHKVINEVVKELLEGVIK